MNPTAHPVPDPTARLQAAATHLRRLLANPELTEGPWLSLDHGDRLLRNQPGDEDRAPVYVVDEPMSNGANADFIEVMDPCVGEALAAWLERAAYAHQATLAAAGQTWASTVDPRAVAFVEHMTDRHALAVADAILAGAEQPSAAEAPAADTLPEWLNHRFGRDPHGWDSLPDDQRGYWEHEAAAVRRAVARGGFKAGEGASA